MYSDDRQNSMYRSSPDLSQGSYNHRRSSSNDSLDGSYHGSHSRQSSGSMENYPTRPHRRTSSSTADPLQFVKLQKQTELAKQAEEQMKVTEENKKFQPPPDTYKTEDVDWQSNLSSWKSRRKSHSSKEYQLKEELESQAREEEEEAKTSLQTKTFSQMQQERERRKSAGTRNFYPLEEDEEETKASRQESSVTRTSSQALSSALKPKAGVADWAQDSNSEGEEETEDNNNNQSLDNKNGLVDDPFDEPNKSPGYRPSPKRRSFGKADIDSYNKSSPERKSWEVRDSVSKQNSRNSLDSSSRANKISDIRNRFEQSEEQPKVTSRTVDTRVDLKSRLKSFEDSDKASSLESDRVSRPRENNRREFVTGARDSRFGNNAVSESVSVETRYSRNYENGADSGATPDTGSPTRNQYAYSSSSTRNTYASLRKSGRDYTEKNIKISQKPNSEKGFGFTVSGGVDQRKPVSVEKVSLGSAADVCEVMGKDEILMINKRDISSLTNQEVNQLITSSIQSGQIELRVKRFLGSNDDEEEDFLSSDEEFESLDHSRGSEHKMDSEMADQNLSHDSRDSRTSQEDFRAAVNNNPVASALDDERRWVSDHLDGGSLDGQSQQAPVDHSPSYEQSEQESVTRGSTHQPPVHFSSHPPSQVSESQADFEPTVEVEMRPTITRREQVKVKAIRSSESEEEPKPSFEVEMRSHHQMEPKDEASGDGPPAILRKWQRQRPKSEYTFDREKSPDKRLSSTLPWMESKIASEDSRNTEELVLERARMDFQLSAPEPPVPSPRRRFDDEKRMDEWNQKQEQQRQPEPQEESGDIHVTVDKEKFVENQNQIRREYDDDVRRAQELAREREEQERQMLEPEMERMRLTEERRLERRIRYQQLQQSAGADNQMYESRDSRENKSYDQRQNRDNQLYEPRQSREPAQSYNIQETYSQPPSQGRSELTFQVQGHGRPEVLVIDPRNRGEDSSSYNFHVKVNQDQMSDGMYVRPEIHHTQSSAYQQPAIDLEAIREEERRKIREEEKKRIEEEEQQRIREREAHLRQQEEQLRQKEEQLRLEQERLQREQQEIRRYRSEQTPDITCFDPPVARVREPSPSYHSTVVQKRPEVIQPTKTQQYSTTVVVEPKTQYSVKSVDPWQQTEAIRGSTDPSGQLRLTREDMVAMNKKATPLQARPNVTPPTSPTSPDGAGPIKRPTPSREQLHSLNAVPKPKFRSSHDWIGSEPSMQQNYRGVSTKHSQIMKKQFSTPQEHWLFEEAERRRRANLDPKSQPRPASHTQFSGPIKPTAENRWRDESPMERRQSPSLNTSFERHRTDGSMPAQIRQTLLQKTAGARGSTGSNYSQDLGMPYSGFTNQGSVSLSQTLPANFNSSSFGNTRQDAPLPPSTRAPPAPDHKGEATLPLSGRQQCSHCNQELGYGAAMIIESLGLSYHVQCFKCCVCHTPLGNGSEGADVRVRVNKLHCPNCYSNDEAGLKYSKV